MGSQSIDKTKHEARAQIRARKKEMDADMLKSLSESVIRRLEEHPLFRQAHTILLYYSLPDEVDTHALVARYAATKNILLPSVRGDMLELHAYRLQDDLADGAYGIYESEGPAFRDYDRIELAVVPGMAFDHAGRRLGRGKGYYDKLLPQLTHCHFIGICFPFQLLDVVPTEDTDIRMHEVLS